MLWVDANHVRYMSGLGFMPLSSEWFLRDSVGNVVNGYRIPAGQLDEIKLELERVGIYFHD